MATLTDKSKVANAIRLYNEAQSMYLVLGGKNTEWPNPAVPTVHQPDTTYDLNIWEKMHNIYLYTYMYFRLNRVPKCRRIFL